jgi:hypothetical protein
VAAGSKKAMSSPPLITKLFSMASMPPQARFSVVENLFSDPENKRSGADGFAQAAHKRIDAAMNIFFTILFLLYRLGSRFY